MLTTAALVGLVACGNEGLDANDVLKPGSYIPMSKEEVMAFGYDSNGNDTITKVEGSQVYYTPDGPNHYSMYRQATILELSSDMKKIKKERFFPLQSATAVPGGEGSIENLNLDASDYISEMLAEGERKSNGAFVFTNISYTLLNTDRELEQVTATSSTPAELGMEKMANESSEMKLTYMGEGVVLVTFTNSIADNGNIALAKSWAAYYRIATPGEIENIRAEVKQLNEEFSNKYKAQVQAEKKAEALAAENAQAEKEPAKAEKEELPTEAGGADDNSEVPAPEGEEEQAAADITVENEQL